MPHAESSQTNEEYYFVDSNITMIKISLYPMHLFLPLVVGFCNKHSITITLFTILNIPLLYIIVEIILIFTVIADINLVIA